LRTAWLVQFAQVEQWIGVGSVDVGSNAALGELLRAEGAALSALVNMGVRFSQHQLAVGRALASNSPLMAALAGLDDRCRAQTFLAGERVTAADWSVAGSVLDVLTLVAPASFGRTGSVSASPEGVPDWPSLRRWFQTVTSFPAWTMATAQCGFRRGGFQREGGQVDVRPDPSVVSRAADASIAHTAEYKLRLRAESAAHHATASAPSSSSSSSSSALAVAASAVQRAANVEDESDEAAEARSMAFLAECGFADVVIHRHAPAHDMPSLRAEAGALGVALCKNLFLKAKKPKDDADTQLYMVVALDDAAVNIDKLAAALGYPRKIQLRMGGPEVLRENLGAKPGHLSPLHLINDTALRVNVVVDSSAFRQTALGFHPMHNAATLAMTPDALRALLERSGHAPRILDFPRTE
jgi:Ala-tRNA(Pro) deacylase